MAHLAHKQAYRDLVERLNRFPQGAPSSDTLYRILRVLVSEREAQVLSLLPIKPFTADQASAILGQDLAATRKVLDELSSRAILVDVERHGQTQYVLPPPMAGFFEFSLMRTGGDLDQKLLSELYHQYLNVEEDFVRELFGTGETQLGRAFVQEAALDERNALHVLDYERASEILRTARHRAVGTCYCRHKMQHLGRNCDAPLEVCMSFGDVADALVRHGYSRPMDAAEGLDLLAQAWERNLVQFGENVREGVHFLCNCCGEAMTAARKFGMLHPVHTTNFLPVVDEAQCNGCGKCVAACPVEAMALVSANDAHKPSRKRARLDEDRCLGCGVCVRTCARGGISLSPRAKRVLTPLNTTHRAIMMAIERGCLQDLIFDNRVLWNHRALAAVLGVILRLPPVKRLLASEQVKSRYLERLLERYRVWPPPGE